MKNKYIFILLFLSIPFLNFAQKKQPEEIKEIKSDIQEVHPVYSTDGKILYFTRIGHKDSKYGEEGQEIWKSEKDGKNWSEPKYVERLNLSRVNLPIGFVNQDTLLINGIYNKKGTKWIKHGISYVTKFNDQWSKPQKIKIPAIARKMDGKYLAGAITPGSNYLTLTYSEQYKGENNYVHIFKRKKGNKLAFSKAKVYKTTLVFNDYRRAVINKEGNEMMFSALSPGMKVDNEIGNQPYSAYITKRSKDENDNWTEWTDPIKLGDSINIKNKSIWGVVRSPDKDKDYLTTASENKNANLNIYSNKIYYTKLNGTITEKVTKKPIPDAVLYNGSEKLQHVNYDSKTGEYNVVLQQEKVYNIKAVASFGESETKTLNLINEQPDKTTKNFVIFNKEAAIERNKVYLSGKIIEESTKDIIPIDSLFTLSINDRISLPKINYENSTYRIKLDKGKSYKLEPSQKGYISRTIHIQVPAIDTLKNVKQNLILVKVEENKAINLQNILFQTGKSNLLESSYEELDKVVKFLKEQEDSKIKLMGHTDSRGSPKSNLRLSYLRVESVKRYMTEKGISRGRIETEGYGHKRPIAPNNTKIGRSLNRRVEFELVSSKKKIGK